MPGKLPQADATAWVSPLKLPGVGGIAAAGGRVYICGRDPADRSDVIAALDLETGSPLWTHTYPAPAQLDYGNSPRATPCYHEGLLITLGATGIVRGLDAETGVPLWKFSFVDAFDVSVPTWGFCGSPLVVGDRLLMQVAQDPGLIALDVWTGKLLWKTSKPEAAYSSLMLDLNPNARSNETAASDQDTVIGLSAKGYFAVRARDGKMIWQRQPELDGDFGVPCPVVTSFGVVFCGENNGLLIRDHGKTELRTLDDTLLADSHTPVAIGNDLLVAYEGLHRIDLTSGKRLWSVAENRITKYASVIASDKIAWVFTEDSEWLSVDTGNGKLLDRRMLSENSIRTLTHPAVAGDRIIVRVGDEIRCWKL